MRAIMLMFDSLNRHMLPPYGNTSVHAPNFRRLAERTVTFDRSYICSMPCMPARRELHTGRPVFLHCGWGPIEPFDDSMPELLKQAGIYTHLCSDHYHYWEDGGATYHTRYNSWEFLRGQEGDPWVGQVAQPPIPHTINDRKGPTRWIRSDWVNRQFQQRDEELPQSKTLEAGLTFIERNHDQDDWFLQIECFDPHEPFVSHRKYLDLYPSDYDGPLFDWPDYRAVTETPQQVHEARRRYMALLSKCDASLGDVLDAMDRHDMWDDTMLIVWTDHGLLLGEHNSWGKNWCPLYEEVAHTPFFLWDPICGKQGERRQSLVQPAIDLPATLLAFFGQPVPPDMLGRPLQPTLEDDTPAHKAGLFGVFGGHVNVTDGRYVYMRGHGGNNAPLNRYTLIPSNLRRLFHNGRFQRTARLTAPWTFTKGAALLQINVDGEDGQKADQTLLFDLKTDPGQQHPLNDPLVERRMINLLVKHMRECDAPAEQYRRLGLEREISACAT